MLSSIIPPQPRPDAEPVLWHYDDLRPLLLEAGRLLTPAEAERRVLVLENPGLRGRSRITGSLYAGLQLILPGEVARCHRHATSAIRFVLEGTGAYTAVEGERTTMHPGDFILTPSWTYHDHGNTSDSPTVWLDGLDMPIVNLFDASFAEHHPREASPNTVREGDSAWRYGANMLPVDFTPGRPSSPLFNYPYERSRQALDELSKGGPLHPCHGFKLRYATRSPAVTRADDWRVHAAAAGWIQRDGAPPDGCGDLRGGGGTRPLARRRDDLRLGAARYLRDAVVAPVSHEADSEAVLFSLSDRPAQQALGLWRERAPDTEA